ncbi:ATP-binding cassette domain-containing protein [Zoogloea sp.]|uniref:ABC transporter ATP-binding protein n=1 Tax=Zoogloea sp. TaxID=49181 RepID=UPI002630EDF1|nr:ATP-binding cassette domain-containing protein [Zoogloea sp.]MDD3353663.1 ATP-binding cassette domain-containing protein [Zoogloea sp.]
MSDFPVLLQGVSTRFGRRWVHRQIDLAVPRGEVVALVGGSGSGKTTLLRQMVGLLEPAEGEVRLFGESLFAGSRSEQLARRRRFGMLFQQGALFSALSVFDNVAFPLREAGITDEELLRDLVFLKLGMVELEPEVAIRMPAELSGGMIKRVALARALALEPELLLLDEPTAGLDPERSAGFVALIRALHRALGLTVVLVTHDLDTLAALATRVAVLAEGGILAFGSLDEIMTVQDPFIERFFHSSRSVTALSRGRRG